MTTPLQVASLIAAIVLIINLETKAYAKETFNNCGRRLVNHEALVISGFESYEGEWPWHAAIYHIQNHETRYRCGGSLIHSNSILTAAHCVFEYNQQIVPSRVIVHLGKHNLIRFGRNSQDFQALKIVAHPSFNISDLSNDIAVIRLSTEAIFTNYVQPVCLWEPDKVKISEVTGKFGTVIGWGITETDELSLTVRQAVMPVVSFSTCLKSNRDFFGAFLSDTNFCAGFQNGTSVCKGDSGGSITFKENGIYRIRGIVSVTLAGQDNHVCDSKQYVIFTDVAKYLTWIEAVVPELKNPLPIMMPKSDTSSGNSGEPSHSYINESDAFTSRRPSMEEDLCIPNPCGTNAQCVNGYNKAYMRRPVCNCFPGYTGNPLVSCTESNFESTPLIQNLCIPNPCGTNAYCYNGHNKANMRRPVCNCLPGYTGNPLANCLVLCQSDDDCNDESNCSKNSCVDRAPKPFEKRFGFGVRVQ